MELKPGKLGEAVYYRALLIVPYGIETHSWIARPFYRKSFNRTLWN